MLDDTDMPTDEIFCELCCAQRYTQTLAVGGEETRVCDDPMCVAQCDD